MAMIWAASEAWPPPRGYSPNIMGHIVPKLVYEYSLVDGCNQLGKNDGCVVGCRAYQDVAGYVPVNNPNRKQGVFFEERWEPLMEDNGKGFFYLQEHVTPQIGNLAKFGYLPENELSTRVAPEPRYFKKRSTEAQEVIELMAQLDDKKTIEVE